MNNLQGYSLCIILIRSCKEIIIVMQAEIFLTAAVCKRRSIVNDLCYAVFAEHQCQ